MTHTKKFNCYDKNVLKDHPTHYQQCYHDRLTCNGNKVYMILLINIYAFLISLVLYTQTSQKEIVFVHIEKDIINI